MALSDLRCRQTPPTTTLQKLSDGGGLQLWIDSTGGRWWRLAYRFKGKQKLLALGVYPAVSLANARQARAIRNNPDRPKFGPGHKRAIVSLVERGGEVVPS